MQYNSYSFSLMIYRNTETEAKSFFNKNYTIRKIRNPKVTV